MVMGHVWCGLILLSVASALYTGSGAGWTAALMDGAGEGLKVTLSIAGPLCLWSGLGRLMQAVGAAGSLAKALGPILERLYPTAKADPLLREYISANFCANLLGLGNAATPMGIQAVRRMKDPAHPHRATDQMCRLVVMNTASVQLLPTTVAALRQSAGAAAPFDLLPCVWASSLFSVCAGLLAAFLLKRWWQDV